MGYFWDHVAVFSSITSQFVPCVPEPVLANQGQGWEVCVANEKYSTTEVIGE